LILEASEVRGALLSPGRKGKGEEEVVVEEEKEEEQEEQEDKEEEEEEEEESGGIPGRGEVEDHVARGREDLVAIVLFGNSPLLLRHHRVKHLLHLTI